MLVTGATSGIGYETAKALAAAGAHVLVHGRTLGKAEGTVVRLQRELEAPQVSPVVADLESHADIAHMIDQVKETTSRLDVLLNNAGLYAPHRHETADGIERTFAVNHLAYAQLADGLLPLLRDTAARGKIVQVASEAHRRARLDMDDLEMQHRRYSGWIQYCNTKLLNILHTRTLAERVAGTGVTANCLHPGFVATALAREGGFLDLLFKLAGKGPLKGARTSVALATGPLGVDANGAYFSHGREAPTTAEAQDPVRADRLEQVTAAYLRARAEASPDGKLETEGLLVHV